jgi:hypothetical protein
MTFAGKKLQDIYDSGAGLLSELESTVSERLKAAKRAHTDNFRANVEVSGSKISKTAAGLQTDLSENVDHSLERLRRISSNEIKESENHALQMVTELANLSEKLKSSIAALKASHEENVDHIGVSFSDRYMTAVEFSKLELEKQDFASIKHLKAHGTFVSNSLQQKLDHVLWESRGEEKQVTGTLFKSYMQKANAIDSHFSTLMQKLSADFQTFYKTLETEATHSESELESASKTLLSRIDDHATSVENRIIENFNKVSEHHKQKLDGDLGSVADDLSGLHDSTTERLSQSTDQLVTSLVDAAAQAQEALKNRCQELKIRIGGEMQSFGSRLNERITVGTALKRTLEGDKDEILNAVRSQIRETKDSFENKISTLISESGSKIRNMAGDAEREILAAQKRSEDSLVVNTQETVKEIKDQVREFLDLVSQHRSSALEEIARSGDTGGGASAEKSAETAKPKRTKKTKEDSESPN